MAKKKVEHRFRIFRMRSTPAAPIGAVIAADENEAIQKAVEEFEIEPQYQKRLIAQRES
jgi:hypothetical protein